MSRLKIDPQRAHISEAKEHARELIASNRKTTIDDTQSKVEYQGESIKV